MRSREELVHVSGYANRPNDFDDLIRILDSEIRLITPTDPEGKKRLKRKPVTIASTITPGATTTISSLTITWYLRCATGLRVSREKPAGVERNSPWSTGRLYGSLAPKIDSFRRSGSGCKSTGIRAPNPGPNLSEG